MMKTLRLFNLAGFAGLFVVATTMPAWAQSQANASGTNAINSPGFTTTPGSGKAGYSSDVLSQAQQLSSELAAAQEAYQAAVQKPDQNAERRFTRRRKCNCDNPEQANLNAVQAKVAQFMDRLKNPSLELLEQKSARSTQAW
jgi:hypothetical protein